MKSFVWVKAALWTALATGAWGCETSTPELAEPTIGEAEQPLAEGWVWAQVQKIVPNDTVPPTNAIASIDVNGDTAAIGWQYSQDGDKGSVDIYIRTLTGWEHQATLARGDGFGYGSNDRFGAAVAVRGDTLVVSSPSVNYSGRNSQENLYGAVYIYTRSNGTWAQTQRLLSPDFGRHVEFAEHLAFDGVTLALSTEVSGGMRGYAVHLYELGPTGWAIKRTIDLPSDSGEVTALASAPDLVAIGHPRWPQSNRYNIIETVDIYAKQAGNWGGPRLSKLPPLAKSALAPPSPQTGPPSWWEPPVSRLLVGLPMKGRCTCMLATATRGPCRTSYCRPSVV